VGARRAPRRSNPRRLLTALRPLLALYRRWPRVAPALAFVGVALVAVLAGDARADHGNRNAPPTARLSVTLDPSSAFTVTADAARSTDSDATPIAGFRFDFGDGSPIVTVNRPATQASHTYTSPGTYSVTLVAFDTAHLDSPPVHVPVTIQGEAAPVARIAARQVTTPPFTVLADASGSTDADATPIASYNFDFGDGSPSVTTTAPAAQAQHTYAAAGTYTISLLAVDTAGNLSAPATTSLAVTDRPVPKVTVSVGYYDTHHMGFPRPKPSPWKGSPGVVFVGTPDRDGAWDSSCLRIQNNTGGTLAGVVVTADIGSHHYALWGTRSIPAGSSLILAQTAEENFDGSDTNAAGCFTCNPNDCVTRVSATVPVVTVSIAGVATRYYDVQQVLNTRGVDAAGCPATGTRNDESAPWTEISDQVAADLLAPGGDPDEPLLRSVAVAQLWLSQPHPNPSRGDLLVEFAVPSPGPVSLGVYDVSGRRVRTVVDDVVGPGRYLHAINLSGHPRGFYCYRLATSDGVLTRSFVLR
jgi:PKD repeat protein